jgi:hypothetical protein
MKKTYIQPEIETAVMPKYAMMDFPASPGAQMNPVPKRRDQVF